MLDTSFTKCYAIRWSAFKDLANSKQFRRIRAGAAQAPDRGGQVWSKFEQLTQDDRRMMPTMMMVIIM